jgi:hypothetical protein
MAYPVLHVIERIVAPLGLRVDATSPWVDARLPDGSRVQTRFLGTPFRCVVLTAEPCRLVQIGFPGAGFRRLRSDLVLMRLLPAEAIPGAAPERPSGRRPTWT